MSAVAKSERNHKIFVARGNGRTLQQIADTHGITRARVGQILSAKRNWGNTLALLPGTESMSAITRELLIRLGYRRAATVRAALKKGKLHLGCTFGMGPHRFSEIVAWAHEQDSLSGRADASRPANPRHRVANSRRHPASQGYGGVERRVLADRRKPMDGLTTRA